MKIAACVILFNPDISVIQNIESYSDNVDLLIIVDNSDKKNESVLSALKSLPNSCYLDNKENKGIAFGLNQGCKLAKAKGFFWLLTMDQDSSFNEDSFHPLVDSPGAVDLKSTGIISPVHKTELLKFTPSQERMKEVRSTMTSGNLLNLDAWERIGGFRDFLFIDFVDHEFCLRLRKYGFHIYECQNAIMHHKLGGSRLFDFMGFRLTTTDHNYIRRYYMTRNRLYTMKKHFINDPVACLTDIYFMSAEVVKIMLGEHDRKRKFKAFFLGIIDFLRGRYGKFRYKF